MLNKKWIVGIIVITLFINFIPSAEAGWFWSTPEEREQAQLEKLAKLRKSVAKNAKDPELETHTKGLQERAKLRSYEADPEIDNVAKIALSKTWRNQGKPKLTTLGDAVSDTAADVALSNTKGMIRSRAAGKYGTMYRNVKQAIKEKAAKDGDTLTESQIDRLTEKKIDKYTANLVIVGVAGATDTFNAIGAAMTFGSPTSATAVLNTGTKAATTFSKVDAAVRKASTAGKLAKADKALRTALKLDKAGKAAKIGKFSVEEAPHNVGEVKNFVQDLNNGATLGEATAHSAVHVGVHIAGFKTAEKGAALLYKGTKTVTRKGVELMSTRAGTPMGKGASKFLYDGAHHAEHHAVHQFGNLVARTSFEAPKAAATISAYVGTSVVASNADSKESKVARSKKITTSAVQGTKQSVTVNSAKWRCEAGICDCIPPGDICFGSEGESYKIGDSFPETDSKFEDVVAVNGIVIKQKSKPITDTALTSKGGFTPNDPFCQTAWDAECEKKYGPQPHQSKPQIVVENGWQCLSATECQCFSNRCVDDNGKVFQAGERKTGGKMDPKTFTLVKSESGELCIKKA